MKSIRKPAFLADLTIMLGGGFFVGALLTLALTYALFAVGITITSLHSLFFLAGSLVWGLSFFSKKIEPVIILLSHVLFYLLFILVGLFASRMYATNWDGVRFSKEVVIGLSCEWNPVKDRRFEQREELAKSYPALCEGDCVSGGHKILAGTVLWSVVTRLFGDYESGKAINIMYALAGLLLLYGMLRKLAFQPPWAAAFAFACILNPVISSQLLSFTHDGQIAVLTSVLALFVLRFFQKFTVHDVALFAVISVLTVAGKVSGVGLVALFGFLVFLRALYFLYRNKKQSRIYLGVACVVVLILAIIGPNRILRPVLGSRAESYSYSSLSASYSLKERFGRNVIRKNPEFAEMNGLEQYFASRLALTRFSVRKPEPAPIFGADIEGLRVYRDAISSPFTGGFGPVYPLIFLLGAVAMLLAIILRKGTLLLYLSIVIVILVSLYFSPSFLPRWSHQGWLLSIFALMALLDRRNSTGDEQEPETPLSPVFSMNLDNRVYRFFGAIALMVVMLDGLIVFSLQMYGYNKDRRIIEQQLNLISVLEQPVKVEFTHYLSPRTWLIKRGIDYEGVEQANPPYIALHKMNMKIEVPEIFLDESIRIHGKEIVPMALLERLDEGVDHSKDLHLNHALYQRQD